MYRHQISRINRFELYRPYLIGKIIKGSKIVDIRHNGQFSLMSLHIDIHLENGNVIYALFYLKMCTDVVKIFSNEETLFEENYGIGRQEIFRRKQQGK